MKRSLIIFFLVSFIFIAFESHCAVIRMPDCTSIQNNDEDNNTMSDQIRIKIGPSIFTATLFDNATAAAFKAMLPMTVYMSELNGNEKFYYLFDNLPTEAFNPGTIHTGDLMIWDSNCLVLFYQNFSTSYGYSRLGRIEDTLGLAAAVGSGGVTVTFELASITGIAQKDVPINFALEQNYPNPFNPSTIIRYSIPVVDAKFASTTRVQIKVYDALGKEAATLVNEQKAAGSYEVKFNASGLASGIYIYQIQAGNFRASKKLIITK